MAITASKSTTLTAPASSTYKYTLSTEFTETGTNTANNTSTISCSASIGASKIAYSVTDGGTLAVYWHDNKTNKDTLVKSITVSSCGTASGANYGTKTASGSITVTHNDDGTLSGYSKAVFTKNKTNSYIPATGNVSTNNTALTSIPRRAMADSVANFNDEQNPVLKYTNAAGNAVTTLQACIAINTSEVETNPTVAYRNISKTGNSYTFNLTEAERTALRNATTGKSRNLWFYIKTVLGGTTYYSWATATMTIVNGEPFIDTVTYSDTNQATTDLSGDDQVIIQGLSRLQFQMYDVEALKGATLSSLTININGNIRTVPFTGTSITSTSYNYNEVDVSENVNAILTLTDSRGFTRSYSIPLTIWEYENPTAIVKISRISNFYTESNITIDAKYSSLNNLNTIDIKYRIKKSEDNEWPESWTTLQDNVETPFSADNNYSWDLQVQLEDALGTIKLYTINGALDVGIPLVFYDLKKRSVGVNAMPSADQALEVSGKLILNGKEIRNDIMTISTATANITNLSATAWATQNVPLTEVYSSVGSQLSYSGNGIKIGSGVTKIKVSFTMLIRGVASPNSFLGGIKKNDAVIINTYQNAPSNTTWVTMNSGEILVDVVEDDIIYMFYGAGVNSTNGISIGGVNFTKLTVEVVE